MSPPRKLSVTATQRLGKRLDRLEAEHKSHETRLDGLDLKVRELRKEFAETAHHGNFEAMYRLEREENIQLRTNGHQAVADQATLARWIVDLDRLCWQLNPTKVPPLARQDDGGPLTPDEQAIIKKFRDELRLGLTPSP